MQDTNLGVGWVKRDSFLFAVNAWENGTDPHEAPHSGTVVEEGRFRISITYGQLSFDAVRTLVQQTPIYVPHGGDIIINDTHINMTNLAIVSGQKLVLRIRRLPRFGSLYFDNAPAITVSGVSSGSVARSVQSPEEDYHDPEHEDTTLLDDWHEEMLTQWSFLIHIPKEHFIIGRTSSRGIR